MKLTGLPVIYDIDPFATSAIQMHPFGAVGYDGLGRRYRYVKAGATALVKGNLLQGPARDTAFTDIAVQAAAAVGDTEIKVTLGGTATVANQFDGGILPVTVTPGIGQNFTIRSHTVTAASGTATFKINEKVLTALTTSSKVTASENSYNKVIQSPTARTGLTVGVAITAIAISEFGWIGVQGQFGVLSDVTVAAVGEGISPSTTTAGAVTKAVTLLERIGTAYVLGVTAKEEPVYLDCP
jgi:hypothetical protein